MICIVSCVYVTCSSDYCVWFLFVFFFKQKTAYEMRISDWSSDVCSSDLQSAASRHEAGSGRRLEWLRVRAQRQDAGSAVRRTDQGALEFARVRRVRAGCRA